MCTGFVLSFLLLSAEAEPAPEDPRGGAAGEVACSQADLDRLRSAAQALAPQAEPLAARLEGCRDLRDEVLLWKAYYHQMRGEYARSAAPGAGSGGLHERFALLGAAAEGDYRPLEALVDNRDPGYARDAESLLVLARALARDRRFDAADRRYREYLALKPDDMDVRIERAFTRVWAEDVHGAIESFDELLGSRDLDDRRRRQIDEARAFSAQRARKLHEREAFMPNSFTGGPEWAWASYRNFSRSSITTGLLRRELSLSLVMHRLLSDDANLVGYEGAIARTFRLPLGAELYGRAGFFYANAGVPLATLVLTRPFEDGPTPLLGLEQDAVARAAGLPRSLAGMTRRTLFAGVRYKRLLDYRFAHGWVTGQGSYDKHVGLLRIDVYQSRAERVVGNAILRLESESHAKVSRFIYSPRSSTMLRPGVEVAGSPAARTHARVEAGYGVVREQPLPEARMGAETLSLGGAGTVLGLAGEVWTEFSCRWAGVLSARGDWTFGGSGQTTYRAGAIFGGIALYPERCDARGAKP